MDRELLTQIKHADDRANVFNRPWYMDELIEAAERMLWLENFTAKLMDGDYTTIYSDDGTVEYHWFDSEGVAQKW